MDYFPDHFLVPDSRFFARYDELLKLLDLRLQKILESELNKGNKIVEVSKGWPGQNSIIVQLANALQVDHILEQGIVYRYTNDPHYWIHEYSTDDSNGSENVDLLVSGQ